MLYKIYTEFVNEKQNAAVEEEIGKIFEGFTAIRSTGYWKGKRELSVIFEIITDCLGTLDIILDLASRIKVINKQESVLVTAQELEVKFI